MFICRILRTIMLETNSKVFVDDVIKSIERDVDLKSDSHLQKKLCYLLHWKPLKNDEKWFLFHLKALFVLKTFRFLSWLFGHVEKTVWLER